MKNKLTTINEEIDRIKSLFTEERLYGNLVEAGPGGMDPSLDDEDTPEKKKETPKKSEPIIITDRDNWGDYKAENGVWYYRRPKGTGTWKKINDAGADNLNKDYPDTLEKSKNNTDNTDNNTNNTNNDTVNTDNNKDNTVNSGTTDTVNSGTTDTVNSGTTDTVNSGTTDTVTTGSTGTTVTDPFDIKDLDILTIGEKGDIRKQNRKLKREIKGDARNKFALCKQLIKNFDNYFLPKIKTRRIPKDAWVKAIEKGQEKIQIDLFEACIKIPKVKDRFGGGNFINGLDRLDSIAGVLSGDIDKETHMSVKMGDGTPQTNDNETTIDDTTTNTTGNTTTNNSGNVKINTDDGVKDKWILFNNSIPWGKLYQKGNRFAIKADSGARIARRGSDRIGDGYIDRYVKNPRNKLPEGLVDAIIKANDKGNAKVKNDGRTVIFTID